MADSWRNWDDIDKIMERVSQLSSVTKYDVIEHFGNLGDMVFFKKLITSKYFTKEEVYNFYTKSRRFKEMKEAGKRVIKEYVEALINKRIPRWYEEDWRKETIPEKIMWHVTSQNKWEILEYFAEHNEQTLRLILSSDYAKAIYRTSRPEHFSKLEIVEHYADAKEGDIPDALYKYVQKTKVFLQEYEKEKTERVESRKEETKKRREERLLSWEDEKGNTIQLFKLNNRRFNSREEYFKVCKKFLESDLTMKGFCTKYKVTSLEGFRQMLEKFAAEDPTIAKQIEEKMKFGQVQYLLFARKLIVGVVKGEINYSEIIKNSKTYTLQDLLDLCDNIFKASPKVKDLFLMRTVEYYHDRISAVKDYSNPEQLKQLLTFEEIKYILKDYEYLKLCRFEEIDVGKSFFNVVKSLEAVYPKFFKDVVIGRGKLREELTYKYSTRFSSKVYFKNKTTIMTDDAKQVEVTEDMVDCAYAFAKTNGLFYSVNTMKSIIRAIANGKIENKIEAKDERQREIEFLYSMLYENMNLQEYFETIEEINFLEGK